MIGLGLTKVVDLIVDLIITRRASQMCKNYTWWGIETGIKEKKTQEIWVRKYFSPYSVYLAEKTVILEVKKIVAKLMCFFSLDKNELLCVIGRKLIIENFPVLESSKQLLVVSMIR